MARFFTLREHVSFCLVGGEQVFLDLSRDRYFRLEPEMAAAFARLRAADGAADCLEDQELGRLMASGLLAAAPTALPMIEARHAAPASSLLEHPNPNAGAQVRRLPEILWQLAAARHQVRSGKLPAALARLRQREAEHSLGRYGSPSYALISSFLASRRLVPFAPNCLTDSLAMASFLVRRRVGFTLVFGVKLRPFGAHCWLQTDDLVLNDSADSVLDFTPILVV